LLGLCHVDILYTGSSSLPSKDAEGTYQRVVQTPDGWTPYWNAPYALTAAEDGILGQVVALVSSSISLLLIV
jgi:hypothetical protein